MQTYKPGYQHCKAPFRVEEALIHDVARGIMLGNADDSVVHVIRIFNREVVGPIESVSSSNTKVRAALNSNIVKTTSAEHEVYLYTTRKAKGKIL